MLRSGFFHVTEFDVLVRTRKIYQIYIYIYIYIYLITIDLFNNMNHAVIWCPVIEILSCITILLTTGNTPVNGFNTTAMFYKQMRNDGNNRRVDT